MKSEAELIEKVKKIRPKTPLIDENALAGFDMSRQRISRLIVSKGDMIELTAESKPVRESLKANYGVLYVESTLHGGSANVKITGKPYYEVPGRNMKKEELDRKQMRERASKVAEFRSAHKGAEVSDKKVVGNTSMGYTKPVSIEDAEKGLSESHGGDSLYANSLRSPDFDLP